MEHFVQETICVCVCSFPGSATFCSVRHALFCGDSMADFINPLPTVTKSNAWSLMCFFDTFDADITKMFGTLPHGKPINVTAKA